MRKLLALSLLLSCAAIASAQLPNSVPPFTTSMFNGEIMVDGIQYPTITTAWNAAVNKASSSGVNQTVNLGVGKYTVTLGGAGAASLTEPQNGTCVSLVGSTAPSQAEDTEFATTTINLTGGGTGGIFINGETSSSTTPPTNCTFRNLNIIVNSGSPSRLAFALLFPWVSGLTIDNVSINDFTWPQSGAAPITIGTTTSHASTFYMHNVIVSNNASLVTPGSRMLYGVYLGAGAQDSTIDTLIVRNAMTAALYNAGTGLTARGIHGFGFPYTCTTAPCNNTDSSSSDAAASWATSFVVQDYGGGGNVYSDTYMDSPAEAAFDLGANGIIVNGGHVQWPETTSFPQANLAWVETSMTSSMVIVNVGCVNMNATHSGNPAFPAGASGVWISYGLTAGLSPANSTVFGLAGCQNFYASRVNARQTVFDLGGNNSSNTNFGPGNPGETPKVLAFPLASEASEGNYESECFTGADSTVGDIFYGGQTSQPSSFAVRCNGTIHAAGGLQTGAATVSAATTLTYINKNVMANAGSAAFTLTLPSCFTPMPDGLTPTGMEITIFKTDSSANSVTLATTSSETMNYQGTVFSSGGLALTSSLHELTLVCGADSNWYAH